MRFLFNPLNAELNPICNLLALLGAHHIIHVGWIRVKGNVEGKIVGTGRRRRRNCLLKHVINRTTFQVFVTYLTGALYVHPLWFYKHQHDNRVRSKLFVACQRWWFQLRFWFVPSVPGYLREEEEHKPDPWHNPIERNHMGLHLECIVNDPTIILNNPVFSEFITVILTQLLSI